MDHVTNATGSACLALPRPSRWHAHAGAPRHPARPHPCLVLTVQGQATVASECGLPLPHGLTRRASWRRGCGRFAFRQVGNGCASGPLGVIKRGYRAYTHSTGQSHLCILRQMGNGCAPGFLGWLVVAAKRRV